MIALSSPFAVTEYFSHAGSLPRGEANETTDLHHIYWSVPVVLARILLSTRSPADRAAYDASLKGKADWQRDSLGIHGLSAT